MTISENSALDLFFLAALLLHAEPLAKHDQIDNRADDVAQAVEAERREEEERLQYIPLEKVMYVHFTLAAGLPDWKL